MATSRWKLAASRRRCAWTLPALSLPEKRQSARLTLILSARVHVVALLAFLAGILGIVAIADGLAVGRAIVAVLLLARLLLLVFILAFAASPLAAALGIRRRGRLLIPGLRPAQRERGVVKCLSASP